jgi:hypothetical protein
MFFITRVGFHWHIIRGAEHMEQAHEVEHDTPPRPVIVVHKAVTHDELKQKDAVYLKSVASSLTSLLMASGAS